MPLKISSPIKKALQDELKITKAEVEDYVWNHKPHECHLCSGSLNRSSDDIELDHDLPSSEGGQDTFANLLLAHVECNRYKRNHSSFDVRPHLRFKRFFDEKMGQVKFKEARQFFELPTTEAYFKLSADGAKATIETSEGTIDVAVHKETVNNKDFLFCFADLPISCIENDDEIQPREIKLNHLIAISSDLKKNPLHEQPAVRLIGSGDKKSFLMFDGQHKTVGQLLNGKSSCTFKIYINIEKSEAVHLVNSIQARIKKLPLTPFELASKMSDEVRRKLETYEEQIGSAKVSEEGFIAWLDPADRSRAKSGVEAAVIDSVIADEELAFSKIIERRGAAISKGFSIKEPAFQTNVLKVLLHTKPLPARFKGEEMKEARERESRNVIKLLNLLYDKGFIPSPDKDSQAEISRIKRLTYQSAMKVLCDIMMQIISSQLVMNKDVVLVEKSLDAAMTEKLALAAERFFAHPVWTAALTAGPNAQRVDDALKKNQDVDEAFKSVGLTAAYCAGLEKLPTNWAGS